MVQVVANRSHRRSTPADLLHVTCYMLHVTCYMCSDGWVVWFRSLQIGLTADRPQRTCYMLHVTCYMLHVFRWLGCMVQIVANRSHRRSTPADLLHVTCYMLHVTCVPMVGLYGSDRCKSVSPQIDPS